jgi:hypothetical protein
MQINITSWNASEVCFILTIQLIYVSSRLSSRLVKVKIKVNPQQAEAALGVPGRLRPRIFLTFGTTRAVGRQP